LGPRGVFQAPIDPRLSSFARVCACVQERAHKLTGGLGDEAVRWEEAAGQLDKDLVNLVGNVLLAAGCVAYVGPFNTEFRTALVQVRCGSGWAFCVVVRWG
jgi:hypothetical protein